MVQSPAVDIPIEARPIATGPHWRFVLRPTVFSEQRIPDIAGCWRLIEACQIRAANLEEYPDIDRSPSQSAQGQDWVASWQDWSYWRLYQSGQFVHLLKLPEEDEDWRQEHEERARGRTRLAANQQMTGLVEAYWALRRIALFSEFAGRLAGRIGLNETFTLDIRLVDVAGRLLYSSEFRRPPRFSPFIASESELRFQKCDVPAVALIGQTQDLAVEAALWFYHRFGWLDAPADLIRRELDGIIQA